MTEKEKRIIVVFKKVLPELTERQKDRLLWMGEGMTFKKEEEKEKEKQTA